MPNEHSVVQENFRLLLNWLDSNDETAGEEYERIRRRLIQIFVRRGCYEAEFLADQTIDRVTSKAPQIVKDYVGQPALYFYGVANKIHLEWLRKQERQRELEFSEVAAEESAVDIEYECLEACLAKLPSSARELILEYYRDEKRAKIDRRKKLALRLGLSMGALQIRASRIRAQLLACVVQCVSEG